MSARGFIARALASSPLPLVARRMRRHELLVLMFHGFASGPLKPFENLEKKHLQVDKWRAFVTWLTSRYRVIPLSDAVRCLQQGKTLPNNAVCVTMDDGFRSTYELAFPELVKSQLPATIYLATEFVDEKKAIWVDRVSYSLVCAGKSLSELREAKNALKRKPQEDIERAVEKIEDETGFRMPLRVDDPSLPATQRSLDWGQVDKMRRSGLVEFGSHTHSHRILGRCSSETTMSELTVSKSIIEERTGSACDLFCYPNGTPGDFTDQTEVLVRQAGFRSSVTTVPGWNRSGCSPFALRRLGVSDATDMVRFNLMVSGVMSWVEGY